MKDHKENFRRNEPVILINPALTNIGKISKWLLDDINNIVIEKSMVNHWKSTESPINWFKNLENKESLTFLKFYVQAMYPSITEKILNNALAFATNYVNISDKDIGIIKLPITTFLFTNKGVWVIKDNSQFDVHKGSLDGAKLCKLVGTFLLSTLVNIFNIGLYRDDGLCALEGSKSQIDRMRTKFVQIFKDNGMNIDDVLISKRVHYLDVVLYLGKDFYKPLRKENSKPRYMHVNSNHPPIIIRKLP